MTGAVQVSLRLGNQTAYDHAVSGGNFLMSVNIHSLADEPRRQFVAIQAAKAALGAVLGLGFFGVVGRPDMAEAIAMAGLMAPAILALLGLTRIPLALLEQASLASFAALIAYLAVLTGGVVSPLTVWFALVPAEAALAGARPAVTRAGIAAGLA